MQVVGEGFHPKAGMPHAEVYALRAAGQQAQAATAYVSLEPCNHFGRTPPCSRAMVAAGVKRVRLCVPPPMFVLHAGHCMQSQLCAGSENASLVIELLCYREGSRQNLYCRWWWALWTPTRWWAAAASRRWKLQASRWS
jgi:tRNA(Arg) A34 adenosine deaminase TadA